MFESLFLKYPFFRVVPCILVMAIIFKLSSLTDVDLKDLPQVWDKLAHCIEYATLAGCYALLWNQNFWLKKSWFYILCVTVLCVIYGATDEFHQSFVEGRDSSIFDVFADLLGGILGGTVYAFAVRIIKRFEPK